MTSPGPRLGLDDARACFAPVPGYLNAATLGLPSRETLTALREELDQWQAGLSMASRYDAAVERCRRAYASLVASPVQDVAVGAQVSPLVALVAAGLPDGADVLTIEDDFASVVFPFLVHRDRGVRVRQVPLPALAEEVRPQTSVVAFSIVQSADGVVVDAPAVREAAAAVGATTVCDLTQAAGWLPVRSGDFDVTVCAAYKWLCAPRGTAFLTAGPHVRDRLRPLHAGWYAGESVWDSVYGPQMVLASSARRFDVSPAWFAWVGAAPVLEMFAQLDVREVKDHDARLADLLRVALGLEAAGRSMVSLPDPDGRRRALLEESGCSVAGRAGKVRMSFHLWNDESDVDRAAHALGAAG